MLMAISNNRIIAYETYKTSINTNIFTNKYLLMDNVAFHKSLIVANTIKQSNNNLLFIPPYSPQLNPIEEVFSKIKHTFASLNTMSPTKNFMKKLTKAIKSVTSNDL
jgi:transposase